MDMVRLAWGTGCVAVEVGGDGEVEVGELLVYDGSVLGGILQGGGRVAGTGRSVLLCFF